MFLIDAVSQRRRRRFVDDALHIQAGDPSRVLCRLALRVGEVCRHGDDGFGNLFAKVCLGVIPQLLQDHRGYLLRRVILAVDAYLIIASHMALNRGNGPVGVRNRLAFGNLTYHSFPCFRKRHNGRGGPATLGIRNNDGLAAFHNRNATICRT